MFHGRTFAVSMTTSPLTVAALTRHGGRVVYDVTEARETPVTCVVIAGMHSNAAASSERRWSSCGWAVANKLSALAENHVRASRIPVVYELWVHRCVQAGRLLPMRKSTAGTEAAAAAVAYDPFVLAGVRFTTTQLPMQLKANIVAQLQFLGATYDRHLMSSTNLVVYSRVQLTPVINRAGEEPCVAAAAAALHGEREVDAGRTPPQKSTVDVASSPCPHALTKLSVARQRGVPCVTPQWVQLCLSANALLAFETTGSPALHDRCGGSTQSIRLDDLTAKAEKRRRSEEEEDTERAAMDEWVRDALSSEPLWAAETPEEEESTDPVELSSAPSLIESLPATPDDDADSVETHSHRARNVAIKTASHAELVDMRDTAEVRAALKLADRLAAAAAAAAASPRGTGGPRKRARRRLRY